MHRFEGRRAQVLKDKHQLLLVVGFGTSLRWIFTYEVPKGTLEAVGTLEVDIDLKFNILIYYE